MAGNESMTVYCVFSVLSTEAATPEGKMHVCYNLKPQRYGHSTSGFVDTNEHRDAGLFFP